MEYELNFALVEDMQSIGSGYTGAVTVIAHLCLGHSQSFAQYFHTLENVLGNTEEAVKENFSQKALDDKKSLSIQNDDIKDENVPLTLSYGKIHYSN